jgi:hypothetical protein
MRKHVQQNKLWQTQKSVFFRFANHNLSLTNGEGLKKFRQSKSKQTGQ